MDYVHGFAGQSLEHRSFFKDWQGMVRGYLEGMVRQTSDDDITVVGIEGGPCSMEEADLMPQLLANTKGNLELLGKDTFSFRWRYYLDFEDFKSDIESWLAFEALQLE